MLSFSSLLPPSSPLYLSPLPLSRSSLLICFQGQDYLATFTRDYDQPLIDVFSELDSFVIEAPCEFEVILFSSLLYLTLPSSK
jgi:hypothetical protein